MKETLEMALEALQGMRDMWASVCISHGWEPNHLSQYDDAGKAIAALKEAIKNQGEPSAEVVVLGNSMRELKWLNTDGLKSGDLLYTSAPTIPQGWQLVPIAPTDAMFAAGDQFMECTSSLGEAWEAMLAAAPKRSDAAKRPVDRRVRPGIYRIRDAKAPRDPELEHGILEIYEHPIKGLCFWDQGQDGDSDGHVPVCFLDGEELEYVEPND